MGVDDIQTQVKGRLEVANEGTRTLAKCKAATGAAMLL